jgi:uncharacterized protein
MISNKENSNFKLVGVIHLPPLPGAVNYQDLDIREIGKTAARDAQTLVECGFTHVMIQDGNDIPQATSANIGTIASLSAIGAKVREAIDAPLGVIVGHNDGPASVAIAKAIGANFIRVKVLVGVASGPNGWIEGCAFEVSSMKRLLESNVEIWADSNEATSKPLVEDKSWSTKQALFLGGATNIIITDDRGAQFALDEIDLVKGQIEKEAEYIVGGRVNLATINQVVTRSSGAIIGSAISGSEWSKSFINSKAAKSFGEATFRN